MPTQKVSEETKDIYKEWVREYSSKYDVDPNLLWAMMEAESSFRSNAVSKESDAVGLLQFLPDTAAEYTEKLGLPKGEPIDLLDPETNIHVGALHLAALRKRTGITDPGDVALQWVAGEGNFKTFVDGGRIFADKSPDVGHNVGSESRNHKRKVEANFSRNRNTAVFPAPVDDALVARKPIPGQRFPPPDDVLVADMAPEGFLPPSIESEEVFKPPRRRLPQEVLDEFPTFPPQPPPSLAQEERRPLGIPSRPQQVSGESNQDFLARWFGGGAPFQAVTTPLEASTLPDVQSRGVPDILGPSLPEDPSQKTPPVTQQPSSPVSDEVRQLSTAELLRREKKIRTQRDRDEFLSDVRRWKSDPSFREELADVRRHGYWSTGSRFKTKLGLAAGTIIPPLAAWAFPPIAPVAIPMAMGSAAGLFGMGVPTGAEALSRRKEGLPWKMQALESGLDIVAPGFPKGFGTTLGFLRGLRGAKPTKLPPGFRFTKDGQVVKEGAKGPSAEVKWAEDVREAQPRRPGEWSETGKYQAGEHRDPIEAILAQLRGETPADPAIIGKGFEKVRGFGPQTAAEMADPAMVHRGPIKTYGAPAARAPGGYRPQLVRDPETGTVHLADERPWDTLTAAEKRTAREARQVEKQVEGPTVSYEGKTIGRGIEDEVHPQVQFERSPPGYKYPSGTSDLYLKDGRFVRPLRPSQRLYTSVDEARKAPLKGLRGKPLKDAKARLAATVTPPGMTPTGVAMAALRELMSPTGKAFMGIDDIAAKGVQVRRDGKFVDLEAPDWYRPLQEEVGTSKLYGPKGGPERLGRAPDREFGGQPGEDRFARLKQDIEEQQFGSAGSLPRPGFAGLGPDNILRWYQAGHDPAVRLSPLIEKHFGSLTGKEGLEALPETLRKDLGLLRAMTDLPFRQTDLVVAASQTFRRALSSYHGHIALGNPLKADEVLQGFAKLDKDGNKIPVTLGELQRWAEYETKHEAYQHAVRNGTVNPNITSGPKPPTENQPLPQPPGGGPSPTKAAEDPLSQIKEVAEKVPKARRKVANAKSPQARQKAQEDLDKTVSTVDQETTVLRNQSKQKDVELIVDAVGPEGMKTPIGKTVLKAAQEQLVVPKPSGTQFGKTGIGVTSQGPAEGYTHEMQLAALRQVAGVLGVIGETLKGGDIAAFNRMYRRAVTEYGTLKGKPEEEWITGGQELPVSNLGRMLEAMVHRGQKLPPDVDPGRGLSAAFLAFERESGRALGSGKREVMFPPQKSNLWTDAHFKLRKWFPGMGGGEPLSQLTPEGAGRNVRRTGMNVPPQVEAFLNKSNKATTKHEVDAARLYLRGEFKRLEAQGKIIADRGRPLDILSEYYERGVSPRALSSKASREGLSKDAIETERFAYKIERMAMAFTIARFETQAFKNIIYTTIGKQAKSFDDALAAKQFDDAFGDALYEFLHGMKPGEKHTSSYEAALKVINKFRDTLGLLVVSIYGTQLVQQQQGGQRASR
jgi:hypothetical protein